jgi:hypothetical protein
LSGRVYAGLTHSVSQEELDDVRVFLEKQLAAAGADPAVAFGGGALGCRRSCPDREEDR